MLCSLVLPCAYPALFMAVKCVRDMVTALFMTAERTSDEIKKSVKNQATNQSIRFKILRDITRVIPIQDGCYNNIMMLF